MVHNRKYTCGGTDLVGIRIRNSLKMMDQDKIEQLIIDSHFLENAPFERVDISYRYGIKNTTIPIYYKISKKYKGLSIAIELKSEILEWADKNNLRLLYDIFMIGALEALINAGEKYNLNISILKSEREKYGSIPETLEECQLYS